VDFSVEDQGNLDVVGGGKRAFYTVCKGPNLAQPYMNLLGLKNKVTTCCESVHRKLSLFIYTM